jgi:uncharacterized coiled-coil protein SlyX
MADHPVNQVCDERFERLDEAGSDTERKVEEHSQMLAEHESLLAAHSRQLQALTQKLDSQGAILQQTQVTLATIVASVTNVKAELDRLNGWQMKLIFFLVIALATLAGVTKAAEIVGAF